MEEMKMPLLFKIVPVFIGIVFLLVIGWFIAVSYFATQVVEHPHEIAKSAGGIVKDFLDGAKGNE